MAAGAAKLVSHFTGWSTVVSPAAVVLALGLLGRGRNLVHGDRLVGADRRHRDVQLFADCGEGQMTDVRFGRFLARVTACHVATYFVCGVIAYYAFDYAGAFASPDVSCYLRPISSKWIPWGPSLNVVRGLVFALALFPFRRVFLEERHGWLKLWGLLLGLCILSTAGPAPGSVEGLIYTQMPWTAQLLGLREVVAQTLAFSYLLVAWHHRPGRAWGIVMAAIMVLVVLAGIGRTLAAQPPR